MLSHIIIHVGTHVYKCTHTIQLYIYACTRIPTQPHTLTQSQAQDHRIPFFSFSTVAAPLFSPWRVQTCAWLEWSRRSTRTSWWRVLTASPQGRPKLDGCSDSYIERIGFFFKFPLVFPIGIYTSHPTAPNSFDLPISRYCKVKEKNSYHNRKRYFRWW